MNIKRLFCVLFITLMLLSVPCAYALDSDVNDNVKVLSSDNEIEELDSNSVNNIKDGESGDSDNVDQDSNSVNPTSAKGPSNFIKSTITLGCKVGMEYAVTDENKAKNAFELFKLRYDKLSDEIDESEEDIKTEGFFKLNYYVFQINKAINDNNYIKAYSMMDETNDCLDDVQCRVDLKGLKRELMKFKKN